MALGAATTFVSTFGAPGGALVLLLMVSLVNEAPSELVGSVFLMYVVGNTVGVLAFSSTKLIDYKTGTVLALPSIPGAILGTYLGLSFSTFEFKVILGAVIVALSILLISGQTKPSFGPRKEQSAAGASRRLVDKADRVFVYHPKLMAGLVVSAMAGFLGGSIGAGGAPLLVSSFILFVGLPAQVALATVQLVFLLLDSTVVIAHFAVNAIDFQYAVWLAVGAAIGSILGMKAVYVARQDVVRSVVAFALLVFGVYLIISPFI